MRISKLLVTFGFARLASARSTRSAFQNFFPDVKNEVTEALNANCSAVFKNYLAEDVKVYGKYCVKTYSCIMQNIPEYTKSNMNSAAVLLGLSPWILSTLGSSTTEMSLLSSKRPILAVLLVLGSPAMNPIKPLEYHDPIAEYLTWNEGQMVAPKLSNARNRIAVLLEFILAIGSLVNVTTLSWELSLKTIPVMSCDFNQLVTLWIVTSLVTHFFGIMIFLTRAKTKDSLLDESEKVTWAKWIKERWQFVHEFSTSGHEQTPELVWSSENWGFIFGSWFTAVWTVAHLAFGTLVFSSLAFVGIVDAPIITLRFALSAVLCKIIVAYELAGVKTSIKEMIQNTQTIDGNWRTGMLEC